MEDPESKEYGAKTNVDLVKKWETFDDRGMTLQNHKDLNQRPSFGHYDVLGDALIEHVIFYPNKTSGDVKFFPGNVSVQWFSDIYDSQFRILNMLQRRKRTKPETTSKKQAIHVFHPGDLVYGVERPTLRNSLRRSPQPSSIEKVMRSRTALSSGLIRFFFREEHTEKEQIRTV